MTYAAHAGVMIKEAVTALAPKKGGVYVDATFGAGWHRWPLVPGLRVVTTAGLGNQDAHLSILPTLQLPVGSAQLELAAHYDTGIGVAQNRATAWMWMRLAEAGGADTAATRLFLEMSATPDEIAEGEAMAQTWREDRQSD